MGCPPRRMTSGLAFEGSLAFPTFRPIRVEANFFL
jgi:hypothetical protein